MLYSKSEQEKKELLNQWQMESHKKEQKELLEMLKEEEKLLKLKMNHEISPHGFWVI